MKKIHLLAVLLIANIAYAQSPIDSTEMKFKKVLEDNHMEFTMPKGTTVIPIVKNRQVRYDYAVKFNDKPIEIRYSIFSLGKRGAEYKKFLKDHPPGSSMADPNVTSKLLAYTVALNLGGGIADPKIEYDAFKPEHVKAEFGADWGGIWFVPIKNNSFGTEYKMCIMISVHRDDVADGYIIFLGNTGEELLKMLKENGGLGGLFYSLKFKE